MRVRRGRGAELATDAQLTRALVEDAVTDDEPYLRVWRPPQQCSFGRRDTSAEGYAIARSKAARRGFPPAERETGGHAVAVTPATVAIALATSVQDHRSNIRERYESVIQPTQRALWRLGVPAQRGEPPDSFCPGSSSLQWRGKLAGFAQRVEREVALVSGVVLVRDHDAIASVLDPVYSALDIAFDPGTVGSVARANGRTDPETVLQTVESAIVGDRPVTIEAHGEMDPADDSPPMSDRED